MSYDMAEMFRDTYQVSENTYQVSDKPFISAWAIRQKSTGAFLPARKNGRGYSFDKPIKGCFPRLFKSKKAANLALYAWLQGQWKKEYHTREVGGWPEDIEYLIAEKIEGRDASDMEIVKFRLVEETTT